jgi:hypothetical protein
MTAAARGALLSPRAGFDASYSQKLDSLGG